MEDGAQLMLVDILYGDIAVLDLVGFLHHLLQLCEDDVAEVVCDFVNCASDDFGWKYGTFSRYSWCGTFEKIMELCGIN